MMKQISCLVVLIVLFFTSCTKPGPATGKGEYDSLFLGIYFGMPKKEFYDYCWEMNKQKKFIHGPTNQNVEYRLENEIDHPVYMRFYPFFYNEKIYQMPVTFTYEAWAPWNREYHADKLIKKVIPLLNKWYGGDFDSTMHPKRGVVYGRIDGNRRINVFVKDEQYVQVVLTDIPAEKRMKAESMEKEQAENSQE